MASEKTNKTILALLTIFGLFLTAVQGVVPIMPVTDPNTIVVISSILMILVNIATIWKQYVSEDIANKAIKRTLFVALIATLAGIGDLFKVFHLSASAGQWFRFGFTVITLFLNIASSYLWPEEAKKFNYKG